MLLVICKGHPEITPVEVEVEDASFAVIERYCDDRHITLDEALDDIIEFGIAEAERVLWRLARRQR